MGFDSAGLDLNKLIKKRIEDFRKGLNEGNLDAALVTKRENYGYMSGFNGTSAYLIISQDSAILLTDFRYVEQAGIQAPLYDVVKYEGKVTAAINKLLKDLKIKRLGFEEGHVTYEAYNEYLLGFEDVEPVPIAGLIEGLRIKKDGYEQAIIKKAVNIADKAFQHILEYIRPGVRETDIAAELEYFMKKQGALGASFEIIAASGKRSSLPHGVASEKVIENGDAVTLDYGAFYMDYCSDMTRTVFVGSVSPELKKIYDIVLEAQLAALEGLKPGLAGRDADAIARSIIEGNGFGNHFGHGLGHGVGREIHEAPRLSPFSDKILEPGMVVTIEPGIYIPDLGGVRIEDMLVVTGEGKSILTESNKELIVV